MHLLLLLLFVGSRLFSEPVPVEQSHSDPCEQNLLLVLRDDREQGVRGWGWGLFKHD